MAVKWLLIASLMLVGLTSGHQTLDDLLKPDADLTVIWDDEKALDGRLRNTPDRITPNRIVDVMINKLVYFLVRKNWSIAKTFNSVKGSVPFKTDSGDRGIEVEITNGCIMNLGSVRRGKGATIDFNKYIMSGGLIFRGLEVKTNYKVSIPAVGQAPSDTRTGKVASQSGTFFVDFEFMIDSDGLPLGIKKWKPRQGQINYSGASGLSGKYEPIFKGVLNDASRSLFERAIAKDLFNIVRNQIMGKMEYEE